MQKELREKALIIRFLHACIHPANAECSLCANPLLGAGDMAVNKTGEAPALGSLYFKWRERQYNTLAYVL